MAQDFGEDVGEMLLIRLIGQHAGKAIGIVAKALLTNAVQRYHQQKLELEGKSKEDAKAEAEVLAKREHICVPFGNATDASYFAKVCQENGVYANAFTDDKGNGYIHFAKDDVSKVQDCVPQFSEVLSSLKNREICDILEKAEPVSQEMFDSLKQADLPNIDKNLFERDITLFPVQVEMDGKNEVLTFSEQDTTGLDIDEQVFFSGYSADALKKMVGRDIGEDFTVLNVGEPYHVKAAKAQEANPKEKEEPTVKDSPYHDRPPHVVDDRVNDAYNHTQGLRDKVLAAREQCRDLDDFRELLAKEGVGITETENGELMFYEARHDANGEILPYGKNEDWAVGAKTLANGKWQCEATLDWFEKNTPKEPTAPAHEAMPPQEDLNLICNAVRGDLEERGIRTLDRPDGKMGFLVDAKHKQETIEAVEARFPGHTPDELGIEFYNPPSPQVADGSLDMDGRTPDFNQGIESHDGMDTAVNTARMEREQSNTDVAPSVVRESSQPRLKEVEKEMRAASKQLSQTNDSPDRDISDKFQQER